MMACSARLASFVSVTALATQALAADLVKPATPANAPVTNAMPTPMDDLNLRKTVLPPALQEAVDNPYNLKGLAQCDQLIASVEALDTAIGKDIDLPQESGSRLAPGDLMNFAANSVIPFRGLIREVSGASGRQRQLQEAVLAGFARRSFLKGLGEARGCAYPAKPASAQIIAAQAAALAASLEALCSDLPDGQRRTKREEWLNSRKCADYKRAKAEAVTAATPTTTHAVATPADASPPRSN